MKIQTLFFCLAALLGVQHPLHSFSIVVSANAVMKQLPPESLFTFQEYIITGTIQNTLVSGPCPCDISGVFLDLETSNSVVEFLGGTTDVGEFVMTPNGIKLDIGDFLANQVNDFTINFRVTQPGGYFMTWILEQNEFNPLQGTPATEGSYGFTVTDPPTADLKLIKTVTSDTLFVCESAFQDVDYELVVINCGPTAAVNVIVIDTLPMDYSYNEPPPGGPCTFDDFSNELRCEKSLLDPGDTFKISVFGSVITEEDTLINKARVSSDTEDPNLLNNEATALTEIIYDYSVLSLLIVCPPEEMMCPNSEIEFSAQITNTGGNDAENVTVQLFASNLINPIPFASKGTLTPEGDGFKLDIQSIGQGETVNISIAGTLGNSNSEFNIVGAYGLCQKPFVFEGCPVQIKPCADLELRKSATPDTICQFDNTTYEIIIKNNGPSPATNIRMVDLLDQGFKIDSSSMSAGCNAVGSALGIVDCTLGDLTPGDSIIIKYSGQATGWGTISNLAECYTDTYDPNTENNKKFYNIYAENLRELVKQKVVSYLQDTYGEELKDVSQVYLCTDLLSDDVTVSSFDPSQFSGVLDQGDHFGWIDWDTDLRFEHPASYLFVSPKGDTVRIEDGMSWWPTMTFFDTLNSFNPFDEKYIVIAADTFKRELIETLKDDDPPEGVDSVCAFIVEGHDERASMQNGFHADGERFKDELSNEKLGPGVKSENIKTIVGSSVEDLKKLIEEQKGKCKKFYFYYSGHGNQFGIYPNSNGFDALSYDDLYASLEKIGAEHYCILIDACHSGTAEAALKSNQYFKDAEVDLYYSSASGKTSTGVNAGEGFYCESYGLFSYNLFSCWGDPEADENGSNGVDLCEAWKWFAKQDPEFLGDKYFERFMPGKLEKAKGQMFEVDESQEYFKLDLNMNYGSLCVEDNGINYNVHLEYVIEEVSPSDLNDKVFAVSKWRRWTIEPSEPSNCDTIDARLSIYVDPYFDIPVGTKGVLGPVTRPGPGEKWSAHYPFLHNLFDETINAYNISHFSQWAIGLVEDQSTPVIEIDQGENVRIYPNPLSNIGSLGFKNQVQSRMKITINNALGVQEQEIWNDEIPSGDFIIKFDVSELPIGQYWIKVEGGVNQTIPVLVVR